MKKRIAIAGMGMLALMLSGVVFSNSAVLADDGKPNIGGVFHFGHGHGHHDEGPHSEEHEKDMREHFKQISPELREKMMQHHEDHEKHHEHHADALSEFLGLTPEELRQRLDNGERPRDILEEQGKTHEELIDFLIEHRDTHMETLSN